MSVLIPNTNSELKTADLQIKMDNSFGHVEVADEEIQYMNLTLTADDSSTVGFRYNYTIDPNRAQIQNLIYAVQIPERWREQGIEPPNISCKKLAEKIIVEVYDRFRLYPIRITATIEGGIFCNYKNFSHNKELSIEIYNDLGCAAILTRGGELLSSYESFQNNIEKPIVDFIAS